MMWLLMSNTATACQPVAVAALMDVFGAAIADGHPEAALATAEDLWQRLPEACAPIAAIDLALIAHRAGALAWDLGQQDLSDQWFDSACRLAPGAVVPASLGPTAAGRARDACERVAERSSGKVVVESSLLINGVPRDAGTQVTLPIGVHLIVWEKAGAWTGRWQTVDDGLPLGLPSGNLVLPTVAPAREGPRLGAPLALTGAGAALAGAGGLVLQFLFAGPWNRECSAHGYTVADPGWKQCEEERGVPLSGGYYGGIGLIAGGAALGLTGIGFGVHAILTDSGAGLALSLPL